MTEPVPLAALEIIGYANRLTPSMMPAVVPPVFRIKEDPSRVLLPAFVIHEGFVCNFSETAGDDVARLDHAGEITLLGTSLPARRDFELWIGEDATLHYESITDAASKLRKIALDRIEQAIAEMTRGNFDAAENFCRIALCADDRLIDPLAISAAIARKRNDRGAERLAAKLAQERISPAGFKKMTDGFYAMLPEQPDTPPADLLVGHAMSGMAAYKVAA